MTSRQPTGKIKKRHGLLFRLNLKRIANRALRSSKTGNRQLKTFASGLTGIWPDPADGPDVILAACDDGYFQQFALALIQSIERLGKRQPVHIHLLDPSEDTIRDVTMLKGKLRNVILTFTADLCVLADSLRHRQIYYTAARFLLAPFILKRGIQQLLIIDVDAVMINSPWPFFSADSTVASAAFIFRPGMRRPWYKVLASAVFFNATTHSIRFSDALARSLAAALAYRPKYHIDQILPHYLCSNAARHVTGFSAIDIPARIMGYDYESDTAFWTVKGKANIDRFLAEKKRLLETLPEAG
jgi:hypothetical protein